MTKKTLFNLFKYVYFTIVLLLPYILIILPFEGINPFTLFLQIPWVFFKVDMTNFEIAIYCLFFMAINFYIAFKLYKIHRKKSIAGSSLRIILVFIGIIFLFSILGAGEVLMIFACPFWGFITFCPLYFWGILYYHRITSEENKFEDDNISK